MQHIHLDLSWYTPYTGDTMQLYSVADWVTTLNGNVGVLNTPRAGVLTHGTWHDPFSNCDHVAGGAAGRWEPLTTPLNRMCSCLETDLFPASGRTRQQRQPSTEKRDREQIDALHALYSSLDSSSTFDVTNRKLDRALMLLIRFAAQGRLLFPQLAASLDGAVDATASRRDAHLVVTRCSTTHILPDVLAFADGTQTLPEPHHTWMWELLQSSRITGEHFRVAAETPDIHVQADYLEGYVTLDTLSRQGIGDAVARLDVDWVRVWSDLAETPADDLKDVVRGRLVELRRTFLTRHFATLCELRDAVAGRTALLRHWGGISHLSNIGTYVDLAEKARGRCGENLYLVPLAVVAANNPDSVAAITATSSGVSGHNYVEVPSGTTIDDAAVRTAGAIETDRQVPLLEIWECAQTLTSQR
jgi:hypothetical protein